MTTREPLDQHIKLVDLIAALAPPPPDWVAVRDRWDQFMELAAVPIRDRLVSAIVGGDGDIPMLRALACSEAGAGSRADVIVEVRGRVYPELIRLYAEAAADNYALVGKQFDSVAAKFTTAAGKCGDHEASSEDVVGQPNTVRDAWLDAAKHAAELDRLVPVLRAAAELAGISTADDTVLLPLLVDPGDAHRRRVWEAFKADGVRTGRWGALAGLGVRIRACELLELAPYRLPKPLVHKQFPAAGPDNRGVYQAVTIDPEDEGYEPPGEPRRRALAR